MDRIEGRIVKGVAGIYSVCCKRKETKDASEGEEVYQCSAKGIFRRKQEKPLVGDVVKIEVLDEDKKTGNIAEILPRKNKLFRPAVANIDQTVIVFACREPQLNRNLLDRFLITMESLDVPSVICFTKTDLASKEEIEVLCRDYEKAGYPVCAFSVREETNSDMESEQMRRLRKLLERKTTAFAGPSGVGKSSLLNYLHPGAGMETGAVSEKIGRGKHTTRHSEIFALGGDSYLFDTPGFSSLDFTWMKKQDLELYFPEFEPYLGKCRFCGCAHVSEPSCAVKQALEDGKISAERYEAYKAFYQELAAQRKY